MSRVYLECLCPVCQEVGNRDGKYPVWFSSVGHLCSFYCIVVVVGNQRATDILLFLGRFTVLFPTCFPRLPA